MALETYELDKKMLEYSISQYRVVPEYVKICEAFCVGLSSIQNSVDYLSDMIDLNKAEGIWLDNIGQLVGQTRSQMIDTDQFFCVNAEDVNKLKRFYFPSLSDRNGGVSDLSDNLFYGQIKAKIAYNISDGTRESNIKIIKQMVNADKVIIENESPMELKISLFGENIITTDIKSRIERVLAPGVGVYGDVTIYAFSSYEQIEVLINQIVEMTNISEVDPNYNVVDIDEDLDYILEIE